ncbi:hypothetical protein SAMD00019534_104160 [Acytostelium subglobosum LB1]|uniref:hypothetical protein n=1 Tax=Acytostelium subglobosum LB1 TaxID=1410327 RepID=UPI000644C139|nr:hypothetical protein SAMD00019534_104160 [Acytostelium subglobosum LB1]GAM27241.1 hypothetical protein SAMD00019534_104160 [Acytostelium subglobosum LB1]|eukprot:XP_012749708.1 hypothetical protein SAMD00019534_104160 [Acytostelium subglobosum LB1]
MMAGNSIDDYGNSNRNTTNNDDDDSLDDSEDCDEVIPTPSTINSDVTDAPHLTEEQKKIINTTYGHKTIGTLGGFCLLIGNMTGPGMVGIALQMQQGGWLLSIFTFMLIMVVSTFAALFLTESMASIPGNSRFQLRVEFSMLVRFYFGKWGYILAQVFINVALQATNIASIIVCAQVMDSMIVFIFKRTCGLEMYPHAFHWTCVDQLTGTTSPFVDMYMFFTIGYLIVLVIIIPLGFLNLEDNIIVQIASFVIMLIITSSWVVMFCMHGLNTDNLPTFGSGRGMAELIGNVMFNYAYITTIPSWVNEAKPSVKISKTVWSSVAFSTVIFLAIGIFGSLSFGNMPTNSDILSIINSSPEANVFSKICVYIFPFVVLASSIPVFSIVVRYNLMQNNLLPRSVANFISVILPWLIVIPFMTGDGLNLITQWSSIIFSSIANFIIPLIIYLQSIRFRKNHRHMTAEQRAILKSLMVESVDWEKNINALQREADQSMYRAAKRFTIRLCKRVAMASLIILSILIPLVIVTTIIFGS